MVTSEKTLTGMPAWQALQEQLRRCSQQLSAGLDIAPSQRFRLEGVAATLIAEGVDVKQLEHACIECAGDRITVTRAGDALRFDCRQQQAPVYPSTAE